ncbi:hypothetical protein ACWKSP_00620 [Micromonosporaceae bacterium Da 78-11]
MTVLAHGIGQAADLPLPLDLVLQAGAATVVVSFLISASLRHRPRIGAGDERTVGDTWWLPPLRLSVLAVAAYLVGNAFLGPRGPQNPVAYAVFVWLWVGLVPLSVLCGPVWRAVNPLRTVFRLLRLPAAGRRPMPAVGLWPAAGALLAFTWLELVAPDRADPLVLGCCLLGYALTQLGLATVYGEDWFAHGDFLEVYSDLAGRLSPLRHRQPLAGLAGTPGSAATATFLAIWWGSTIFDSFTGSPVWVNFQHKAGHPVAYASVGLILLCGMVLVAVRLLAGRLDVTISLIPIAVGYTVAHYLSLLLVEGPHGLQLALRQWGVAEDADWGVAPMPGLIPILQITLILLGHVLGVVIAHDTALAASPGRPALAALADELPVTLFMIGCTWAGLFLLFVR